MTCQNEAAPERGEELMEIDIADAASNGCTTQIKENGLLLWPVLPQEAGEGLPYAPVDWPNPGDIWGWRVGKRVAASGYYLDRYLYLPLRFQKSRRKRDGFKSKLSVDQYVRGKFPGADVNAFFSSFSWKIPSKQAYLLKGDEHGSLRISSDELAELARSSNPPGVAVCKAGNRFCPSLVEEKSQSSASQVCDVCCSEPGFCRECCCILCCNTLDLAFGGYSFIRCATTASDDLLCGHATHLNCALRSYVAGTVGGCVGLDTEYYCRRCDTRTDLTNHITTLLKTCESIESQTDIEKLLSVGSCILRGSQKKGSQMLLKHIESILDKLKQGSGLQDVWKVETDVVSPTAGQLSPSGQSDNIDYTVSDIGDNNLTHESEYLKLDDEISQVLEELKKSQEQEFTIARERLQAQKDYLFCLYQHIENEKAELACPTPSTDREALQSSILVREEHLRRELMKLKDMEKIGNGFGKTSKNLLREHFDIDLED